MGYEVIVIHAINTRDKAGPYLWRVNLTIEIWSIYAKKRKKKFRVDSSRISGNPPTWVGAYNIVCD
jgi:hypothetical protein